MIKNILLDFAGVIMNLNMERDTKSLLAAGLPDWEGCMKNIQLKNVLLSYLNGLMTWEDFLPAIKPFCKADVTEQEIFDAMHDVLDDVPASRVEWILSLREKYKVYLLSNISEDSWTICKERFEASGHTLEECFDKVFLSYELRLAKPDKRIYQAVENATGLVPIETLYYDDSIENIDAGHHRGYRCIHVIMNNLEHSRKCIPTIKHGKVSNQDIYYNIYLYDDGIVTGSTLHSSFNIAPSYEEYLQMDIKRLEQMIAKEEQEGAERTYEMYGSSGGR